MIPDNVSKGAQLVIEHSTRVIYKHRPKRYGKRISAYLWAKLCIVLSTENK